MNKKSLGILVTSKKHGSHLYPLFRAAKRKNIALTVHLQGDGVSLCLEKRCQEMLDLVQFTICRNSAESLGLVDKIQTCYPHLLTSAAASPAVIGACTKHMVL